MQVKVMPEFFVSYKVYEIVMEVLNSLGEKNCEKILRELINSEPKEGFLKNLALILKKHFHASKASNVILKIKEKLSRLLTFKIDPKEIEISKNGKEVLRVYVQNNTEVVLKFRVGVQQIDRKYTAILYDPVKAFGYTKLVKSKIIDPSKIGVFKFLIKPDIYGIQDLYDLNKNKEINITLGVQIEAEGVDGVKSKVIKVPVKITKVLK